MLTTLIKPQLHTGSLLLTGQEAVLGQNIYIIRVTQAFTPDIQIKAETSQQFVLSLLSEIIKNI